MHRNWSRCAWKALMSIPVETGSRRAPRRRLLRDTSGAAAVEFSRVAFPFIAIVVATLELAVDYL
jgi:Flp pilus assembly protein TadG